MSLFGRGKRERAVEAFRSQFGIDLYEGGHYNSEKWLEYGVSILNGYDFVAVVNHKEMGRLVEKGWYIFDRHKGWVKKAAMDRKQSLQLYADTKPYYYSEILEDFDGVLPAEKAESACCMICDEYISAYMTKRYFGFSIKVPADALWTRGTSHTQAIYMPHRDPDPRNESPTERAARMKRIDELVDQLANLVK